MLSLDGGDAKGFYTIGVLKEIEAMAVRRPLCESFDVIFGTSTGAIIAALLALGYRVPKAACRLFDGRQRLVENGKRPGTISQSSPASTVTSGAFPLSSSRRRIGEFLDRWQ